MRFGTVLKMVAAVALAAVVGLIAAAKSLDSKRYQAALAEQIKAASGLVLSFSGPTKLKLGLNPQISFTGMTLATATKGRPLLYIDRIEARVTLLPLIFREIRLEQLRLIRPALRLEAASRLAGAPLPLDLTAPFQTVPATRLALADIRMEDATIVWRSANGGSENRLALNQARIQPETAEGGPLTLQASGAWNNTGFELDGVVGSLRGLSSGKPYPVQLKASIAGNVVVARGTIAEPLAARGVDLHLQAQGDELSDLLQRTGITLGGKPVAATGPYKISARLSDAQGGFGLSDLDAVLGKRDNLLLGLKGEIKTLAPLGGVELAVTAEADNLAGLGRLMVVDLPAAGPLKLAARLNDMENGWRLTGIKSTLGHSDFSGELALAQAQRPRLFGRLAATSFIPADFSFPLAKGSEQNRATSPQHPAIAVIDGRILSPDPLPLDGLKLFDLDLSLVAARLQVGPTILHDASAEIHLAGGKLAVESFSAQLGDGRLGGEARLDTTARTPGFFLHLAGTGLNLAALGGTSPAAGGHGDLAVTLKSGGASPRALAGNLDGNAWISLGETTLAPAEAFAPAPRLIAALDPSSPAAITLRCAALRLTVKDGLLRADKGIALETARTAILGTGTIDLRTEAVDLAFVARGGGSARLRGMLAAPSLSTGEPAPRLAPDASPCRTIARH